MNRMISSFVASLGTLASLWPSTTPHRYPHRSEMEALRTDVVKVGTDLGRTIEREHEKLEARS